MRSCDQPDALFLQPAQASDVHMIVFPAVYARRYAVRQFPRGLWQHRRRALEREDEREQHGCTCQILKF
jgi:hypothetical protein